MRLHHAVCQLALAATALFNTSHARDAAVDCASGPATQAASTARAALQTPLRVAGLTAQGQLVCFRERGDALHTVGTVQGFDGGDTRLIGIDYRPQDGLLYGVGDAGGLYRIDTATAVATRVGALTTAPDAAATAFGVDFNPAANALRIVSSTGQNLRQSFANLGTAMPLAPTAVDVALNNGAGTAVTGVLAAAYTNNDLDPTTATTLFVLSGASVALQSPANAGQVVATGSLGVTPAGYAGFDIYSVLRGNVTVAQRALATLGDAGSSMLYAVDLLHGRAEPVRALAQPVVAIAVPLNQH
jgi:hypothetical protein